MFKTVFQVHNSSVVTTVYNVQVYSHSYYNIHVQLIISFHNILSCIQHSSMFTIFFHVHNSLSQQSQQSTMFTTIFHVHNILSQQSSMIHVHNSFLCSQHFPKLIIFFHYILPCPQKSSMFTNFFHVYKFPPCSKQPFLFIKVYHGDSSLLTVHLQSFSWS